MLGNAQDTVYGDPGYTTALTEIAPNLPQVVTANQTAGESWADTLQRLLPTMMATYQQKEMMDINIQRARQGLPPLAINDYTGMGVNVGLSSSAQRTLLILGGAGLAAVVFTSFMRTRRG